MAGIAGKKKVSQFNGHPWNPVTFSSNRLTASSKGVVAGGGSHEQEERRGATAKWAHVAH
jgi:hypothetical protein